METLKKIIAVLEKNHKKKLYLLVFLMVLSMFFEILSLGSILPVLTFFTDPEKVINYLNHYNLNFNINIKKDNYIFVFFILILLLFFIKILFLVFLNWWQSHLVFLVETKLSKQLYEGYLNQSLEYFDNRNSSDLIRNIITGISYFSGSIMFISIFITELLVIIGASCLLIYVEPIGAIFIGLVFICSALIYYKVTKTKILDWGKKRQFYDAKKLKSLQQGFNGIHIIKFLNREIFFVKEFSFNNYKNAQVSKYQMILNSIPRLWFELISVFTVISLLFILVMQGKTIDTIIPTLGLFVATAFRFLPSANRILISIQNLKFSYPFIHTIFTEMKEIKKFNTIKFSKKNDLFFNKIIEFRDVNFRYANTKNWILKKLNFKVKIGSTLGIIGESGSGKSTVIKLLTGLINPNSGSIKVDGKNIKSNIKNWQKSISYVPQNVFLIDDSIRKNITFGIDDKFIDENQLDYSLKVAQIRDFVDSLPEGKNTIVGERGIKLSGGQIQRIGIARALYNKSSVLILDEATSSLDTKTERNFLKFINKLTDFKLKIIVTHRKSSLIICNEIFEMKLGNFKKVIYGKRGTNV